MNHSFEVNFWDKYISSTRLFALSISFLLSMMALELVLGLSGDSKLLISSTADINSAAAVLAQLFPRPKLPSGGHSCQPKCPPHFVLTTITFGFIMHFSNEFIACLPTRKSSCEDSFRSGTVNVCKRIEVDHQWTSQI